MKKRPIRPLVSKGQITRLVNKRDLHIQKIQELLELKRLIFQCESEGKSPERILGKETFEFAIEELAKHGVHKSGPSRKDMLSEVQTMLKGRKAKSKLTGTVRISTWNMEFFDKVKYQRYPDTYQLIVGMDHLIACQEVADDGLTDLSNDLGYKAKWSSNNSRNQRVGFMWDPEILELISSREYHEITNVQGVKDLRPGLEGKFRHKKTGYIFYIIVLHLKSKRGGPKVSGSIRRDQFEEIDKKVHSQYPTILLGDFNCTYGKDSEWSALTKNGWSVVRPNSTIPTHRWPSRIDYLVHNTSSQPTPLTFCNYIVDNYWQNKVIGTTLSDHGKVSAELCIPNAPTPDPDCQCADDDEDTNTDDITKFIDGDVDEGDNSDEQSDSDGDSDENKAKDGEQSDKTASDTAPVVKTLPELIAPSLVPVVKLDKPRTRRARKTAPRKSSGKSQRKDKRKSARKPSKKSSRKTRR